MSRRALALVGVAVVLATSGAVRFINLSRPSDYIFDEVYYAKDAKTIIDGQLGPKQAALSWEPGKEISWPHPEYGKLAIAVGILAFGDHSFGWRFMPALAGLALLFFIYPIARRLGLNRGWALAALVLAAADTLGIAQSRIATLDIFVGLWTVACIYLALRYVQNGHRWYWLLLCGLAGGLAAGTKWAGGLALLVAAVLVVLYRRREPHRHGRSDDTAEQLGDAGEWPETDEDEARQGADAGSVEPVPIVGVRLLRAARSTLLPILLLLILPAALYFASYYFYFAAGHNLGDWWEMQRQALFFNLHLHATHTYASAAPTWILDARPVWYFYQGPPKVPLVHGVVALGNPLLWWSAVLALVALPMMAIGDRDRRLAIPALIVALLYFPWFAATRTSFLYYMTPVAPFLAVMVATMLQRFTGERQRLPRLRASEATAGDSTSLQRVALGALAFAATGLITMLLWRTIGHQAAELLWRRPARSAPADAYAATAAAAAVGFGIIGVVALRVRGLTAWRTIGWGYVGIVAGLAVVFLPVIVDIGISPTLYYQLMWLPSSI